MGYLVDKNLRGKVYTVQTASKEPFCSGVARESSGVARDSSGEARDSSVVAREILDMNIAVKTRNLWTEKTGIKKTEVFNKKQRKVIREGVKKKLIIKLEFFHTKK